MKSMHFASKTNDSTLRCPLYNEIVILLPKLTSVWSVDPAVGCDEEPCCARKSYCAARSIKIYLSCLDTLGGCCALLGQGLIMDNRMMGQGLLAFLLA
jgi:hypothetical protein